MADLSPSIIRFFTERMNSHSRVDHLEQLPHQTDCLFKIHRRDGLPPVTVQLSDAYDFGEGEYLAKSSQADFILVAKPEARFDESVTRLAQSDRIGVGRLGKLMGALNRLEVWRYEKRSE
jgi:hypothetical protein